MTLAAAGVLASGVRAPSAVTHASADQPVAAVALRAGLVIERSAAPLEEICQRSDPPG